MNPVLKRPGRFASRPFYFPVETTGEVFRQTAAQRAVF
jgi:hypothetical protein